MAGTIRSETDDGGVLTAWVDLSDRPVNLLSAAVWDDLELLVGRVAHAPPSGLVIASAKPGSFVAGADLHTVLDLDDDALRAHILRGQRILDELESLPFTTVAAIAGDALGGGLELALACRLRVVVDDPRIGLGLPETTLGLVPAWGGTSRLPRRVGLAAGLKMLVTGKTLHPADALSIGLVDAVVADEELLAVARRLAAAPAALSAKPWPADTAAILDRSRADTLARSGGNLPAPRAIIDLVETGWRQLPAVAAEAQRETLLRLRRSDACRHLVRLFFLRSAAKRRAAIVAGGTPALVKHAVVVGGGTMGTGIAVALRGAGIEVQLIEADDSSAAAASARLAGWGESIAVTTDFSAVGQADLVVEAVVESLAAKREVFARLDEQAPASAILASNTSSLAIAALAAGSRHPGRVIGLHFFNPVAKMPLVEVVRWSGSSPDAVATGVAVAVRAGKTPVVVNDSPGFIVNRVLFPYLGEAISAVEAGMSVAGIDSALRAYGMPMGPLELADEIGLDVVRAIFGALQRPLGQRFEPPPLLERMVARGWLGKKNGRGFFLHSPGARPIPNPDLVAECRAAADNAALPIADRLVTRMADEARMLLDGGVVESADAIDLATVLGMGFAPFRGGLATAGGLSLPMERMHP
ncbi:MAG: hypothetical protein DWH79_12290 [Planctomycetota bacterium]|nr:MAG: hypothetical protein DWH79_12290 [Planctomycetota bacterium]